MSKKSGRSIRSLLEEKIQTPTQKHFHHLGKKDNFPAEESNPPNVHKRKQRLLELFKEREKSLAKGETAKKKEE